uniref:Uncharacterized protein n=1 Tax=Arundo donax TaxID=35708 RepID=A0A0A8YZI3_ARUDO
MLDDVQIGLMVMYKLELEAKKICLSTAANSIRSDDKNVSKMRYPLGSSAKLQTCLCGALRPRYPQVSQAVIRGAREVMVPKILLT